VPYREQWAVKQPLEVQNGMEDDGVIGQMWFAHNYIGAACSGNVFRPDERRQRAADILVIRQQDRGYFGQAPDGLPRPTRGLDV
jgi:hypothetical protein